MNFVCRFLTLLACAAATFASTASAAVFQYTVPVAAGNKDSAAFLWIPPGAKQIRGAVVAGMTLAEREIAKDPAIRRACADEGLAIVFFRCGLNAADLQKTLDDLAKASGYQELSVAPLFFVGHSAGGPQAKDQAIKYANRCFGLMQYRGGHPAIGPPGGAQPLPPGIPALMMLGQFDEFATSWRDEAGREAWEGGRDSLASYRALDPRNLGSVVAEPGAGHFAWSNRNADYLAKFLRKAAQARIPASWPTDAAKPVPLKEILLASGWLTDLTIKPGKGAAAAPYDKYTGDKAKAAWHFDEEMANATVAYHADLGKKDQFIRWQDATTLDAGVRHFFNDLKWIGDGQTFQIHPTYADKYPTAKSMEVSKWAEAGKPAGHSDAPIRVAIVGGPIAVAGPTSLRIRYDALAPAGEPSRSTFLAFSPGDKEYRHTEHVGMTPRSFAGITAGKDQTIDFPSLNNMKVGDAPVALKASSSSGLPVEFYVAHGPAVIVDGKLQLAEIPTRATFPIPIKIVAYQFGRGLEPKVKTATPVVREVIVER